MKMMTVKFELNGIEKEITTNNQADIDVFLKRGYHPISVKFVPGGEERIEPEPEDKRIPITLEYMLNEINNTLKVGAAKLNAKIVNRHDPELLKWYAKFPRFHSRLTEEELIEGKMQLEFEKLQGEIK